ncbi:VC2046/SO_2500 family protein [Aliiglaciecola sp. LCG003]|uniref:VC2046/SO_2500 family protein n=1 Tax=Aliiglaciecola sp. LCG003 TaxID=3053655 RepID=UPI0025741A0C|nr:VC2046/SO_2500 family protein [Aliiglaciecola sp. LCG003]WJG10998.1 VC2046/SO_2500 family protein [Aliiglaciecola sp. LCG003]
MNSEQLKASAVKIHDLEWSGSVNRSLGHGGKFALLMSMLEGDFLNRPEIIETQDSDPKTDPLANLRGLYRSPALQATVADWQLADTGAKMFQRKPYDAVLWNALHPQPLSMRDDAKHIEAEVLANCGLSTQQRLSGQAAKIIQVDETKLYDVLNQLS